MVYGHEGVEVSNLKSPYMFFLFKQGRLSHNPSAVQESVPPCARSTDVSSSLEKFLASWTSTPSSCRSSLRNLKIGPARKEFVTLESR